MNNLSQFHPLPKLLGGAALLLSLAACAQPQAGAPSYAMKQQLQDLRQQQQQQQSLLASLQEQIQALQQRLPEQQASQPVRPFTPAATVQEQPPRSAVQGISQEDVAVIAGSAADYLSAFSELASAHYSAAESGFNGFLQKYPGHQYAPNARYWLATAQAEQGKRAQAMTNLNQIVTAPGAEEKAPAALAMLIRLYQQAGMTNQANSALNQLRDRYPHAPETQQYIQSEAPVNSRD